MDNDESSFLSPNWKYPRNKGALRKVLYQSENYVPLVVGMLLSIHRPHDFETNPITDDDVAKVLSDRVKGNLSAGDVREALEQVKSHRIAFDDLYRKLSHQIQEMKADNSPMETYPKLAKVIKQLRIDLAKTKTVPKPREQMVTRGAARALAEAQRAMIAAEAMKKEQQ